MQLSLQTTTVPIASVFKTYRHLKTSNTSWDGDISVYLKSQKQRRKTSTICCGLPETAASVAIAATVVGTAATIFMAKRKDSEETVVPLKTCEECGGSGLCPECKGEGFVLKRLSDESAEKARMNAKNAATRYTAGLPKKWSYCTRCSSARSCRTCGGSGKLSY